MKKENKTQYIVTRTFNGTKTLTELIERLILIEVKEKNSNGLEKT